MIFPHIVVLEKLEEGIQSMFDWFSENFLKGNADKCHLIASSKVCVCVFTSIHLEGFIYLGLVVQDTDQRCCVEDAFFLYQVPSSILQYESPSLSN